VGWAFDLWRDNALLALGVVLFLAGLGVPGPASIAIIATGALIRRGHADLLPALAVALPCAIAGDLLSYTLARRGLGTWLEKQKTQRRWRKAVERFQENAPLTLFLARWLFTPISLAVTYIAGSSRYPLSKFLAASISGQAVWILLYGSAGYFLGRQWKSAATSMPLYLIAAGAILLFVIVGWVLITRRNHLNAKGL
jgi:membrane-associated protein